MENNNNIAPNQIAIVGMAGRFPSATSVDEYWQNLVAGKQSSTELTDEELRNSGVPEELIADPNFVKKSYIVDAVDKFDANFFGFTARDAQITDPQQRMLLECSYEALEHAGYSNEKYDGLVGVYAGVGPMAYYIRNLLPNRTLLDSVGTLRMSIGNEKSFAATMVSYKLNLRGPSINVDTACSTSLVAIHQACQSLLSYECDMALAGGVCLDTPQKIGMHYTEGSIISPDGSCKPFDEDAKGTVKGNGAGLLVLKRLEDALEDGDTIYAVVKGSAVNNDGAFKVGYTASSVEGQVDVISEALARADIDPSSMRFVEAHGTGTILGDPIEVKALSEVYSNYTDNKQFCAIGSVKANVGHLDIAAGVAGVIKSSMAIHTKTLPKNINFTAPNPNIDFDNSPFFVNTDNLSLQSDTEIVAAVSSFGIGGSNAHLILGEAPQLVSDEANRPQQLIVASAKTPQSLDMQLNKIAQYLTDTVDVNLADFAYTMQVGRNEYEHRAVVVGSSAEQVAEAISQGASQVITSHNDNEDANVYFMFPGQGAQHVGMAKSLYQQEVQFKSVVDECATLFEQHLGFDIRSYLFAQDNDADLTSTLLSQTALFTIEYAMAKLWQANGIEATAMIGHSLGEYVAACLAGVFSLEDAIKLVAARASLMNKVAPGSMLMIQQGEAQVRDYLNEQICLAAVNGEAISVVSGQSDAISALQAQLQGQNVDCRILHTSHAFHSHMLDPILGEFKQVLDGIAFNAPVQPFISNVTGDWIEVSQATSANYWVNHLRGTVQFANGLNTILQDSKAVLLEVGPGQVLSTLAKRSFQVKNSIASARHAKDQRCDVDTWLRAFGALWQAGVAVDWSLLHQGSFRRRIAAPTYQFDKQSYWVGNDAQTTQEVAVTESSAAGTEQQPSLDAGIDAIVARIWQDAFGIDKVDLSENFFQLGGDSLLATQLLSRVRQELDVQVTLSELFESTDLADFIAIVQGHAGEDEASKASNLKISVVEPDFENRYQPFPLTDIQQAYWVGRSSAVELGDVSTTIYLEVEIKAGEIAKFERSWNRLIEQHEMLRAIFLDSGEQQILPAVPEYKFDIIDVSNCDESSAEAQAMALREKMSHQVLPCATWPLFDIKAVQYSEQSFRLCINIDVLIVDAWSMNMIIEQWLQLYHKPETSLPKLDFSFRDYVIAEHALRETEAYYQSEQYWFDRIDSLPNAPKLPMVTSPTAVKDAKFERFNYDMEATRWKRLKQKALANGVTPNSVLISAFSEVLSMWCENSHFSLCLTNYNRHPFHAQVDDITGDFTSLTILEIDNQLETPFIDRVGATQTRLWKDLDNRLVSAVHVLREMSKRRNERVMLPVVFTSTLGGRELEHEQTQEDFAQEGYGLSQSSQVWLDHQVLEWQGMLRFNWDSVASLFPQGMIKSMFDTYCALLEQLVDSDDIWHAVTPIRQSEIAPPMECKQFEDHILHHGLQRLATTHGESFAVASAGDELSYAQLDNVADHIASRVHELGVEKEELVAVIMPKGWQQVAATHGILRAGGAYLPIDPEWPTQRQQDLIETTNAKVLITHPEYEQHFSAWPVSVIGVDSQWQHSKPAQLVNVDVQPEDLAYVIFTSGSTGKPKGVMIDHRGAMNTICDINERFNVTAKDRIFGLSALSFDLSVYDNFGPYFVGAGLVIPAGEQIKDPSGWNGLLTQYDVSVWNTVPALFQILAEYQEHKGVNFPALRLAMLSGDWIPLNLPTDAREKLNDKLEIISLGGATECSIWSVFYPIDEVKPEWKSIPYGVGLTNQRLYVLNKQLDECPVGVTGDIYIAGVGLALGYYKDEEKTNAHFIVHPTTGERLYRTGDCGKYFADGCIEFLGRNDNQVKVNGYRIELGEIESAIRDCGLFDDVVVVAQGSNKPGAQTSTRLIAYLLTSTDSASGGVANAEAQLVSQLADKIPSYMIPNAYVTMDKLPLTANGKVDRKALVSQEIKVTYTREKIAAKNDTERRIAGIWASVLGFDDFSTDDNFFEIGGDSVSILKVHQQLVKEFGSGLTVVEMFKHPKIVALAQFIDTLAPVARSKEDLKAKANKQKAALGRKRGASKRRVNS
ncbi:MULTISPECIES: hybrid non-ribosomal peptide synthetase/type I polyketide synthase [Pseudoalteromonas]|uniref:Non-ribosomal peptide synthetase n=1 Tax=Pseudoalteromonas amylolytica TaxID=1859457 RepID=A0A1S1MUK6_9GAMM|nr:MULTISPECIES: hybrid non-ribosomal peptide synthetase/type I polyketide synthase [Pseudoalteromonas]OHU90805.1 hypothetical protein BFC16_04185 [Pseudoalteromonas sp. JW3]OHU92575.1 hypothetical protein BET10_03705 [Pseudoalteromonas amylolytica]